MYLEETEFKGTYISSSTGSVCDPVGGRRWTHESLKSSAEMNYITVRLTFLTKSICTRPNFQVLPWFEFDWLVKGEL